jgi:hypothetical protein
MALTDYLSATLIAAVAGPLIGLTHSAHYGRMVLLACAILAAQAVFGRYWPARPPVRPGRVALAVRHLAHCPAGAVAVGVVGAAAGSPSDGAMNSGCAVRNAPSVPSWAALIISSDSGFRSSK